MPRDKTRSKLSMRALVVVQALFLMAALCVPVAALASISGVVIGAQTPNPVVQGNSATYTVTTTTGGSSRATAITAVSGLPTGAGFSSDCVVSNNSGSTHNTLTITTTGSTPAATTSGMAVTVTAYTSNTACGGATNAIDSSRTISLVVAAAKVNTTTVITSDAPDPSSVGAAYTVDVSVTRASGSATITGTVTVSDGTDACNDTTPTGGTGATVTYSCNLTSTTAGGKTLTATYAGNAAFNGSSGTTSHAVDKIGDDDGDHLRRPRSLRRRLGLCGHGDRHPVLGQRGDHGHHVHLRWHVLLHCRHADRGPDHRHLRVQPHLDDRRQQDPHRQLPGQRDLRREHGHRCAHCSER